MKTIEKRIESVRDALNEAGKGLTAPDWKKLLEEIAADIKGHLDAIREESDDED